MSIATRMIRIPRAFDPELGAAVAAEVPDAGADLAGLLTGAAGSSPYLNGLILREKTWLPEALNDPEGALAAEMADLAGQAADAMPTALRRAKRRLALITALADLAGAWSLTEVTRALTDFAALACNLAVRTAMRPLLQRGKFPGQTEDDLEDAAGFVALAMGKMGAFELNYSSDIDLICLFDETRFEPEDYMEARQSFVRVTRAMAAMLGDRTSEGYVFRTDLRLRPDPSVTPVCIAMEAAERYYESLGRTWERAAYIKARPAAGDIKAGDRFLKTLQPFVWRRHLDFAAIRDAHDMRLRIRDHKGLAGPITVPGHDMKLGRGGIREIEFFTQTRQLISGGRDASLRARGTQEGLSLLAQADWIPAETARTLSTHYIAHRTLEHRIQMIHDAQTHAMPTTKEGIARIACLMDCTTDALIQETKDRLTEVHALTEGFFAPAQTAPRAAPSFDISLTARWPTYPALRSPRAAQLFDRLRPGLLERVEKTARPEQTLAALDGFLAGLPAGVQLFSLFESNPQLIDLLIDIAGTAPALAAYLSRNASVFDAVIGGTFFAEWPGAEALEAEIVKVLEQETDYERQLDAVRRWAKDWHFRIGVHHLRGLIDAQEAGQQYADLAAAVIRALWPAVVAQFARKHGDPPGAGAVLLGMGSLGAGQLNATSDLDIIVIYDPLDEEQSNGPRPLAARSYYARLTQAMITAMTAPMSEGRLYEVDMRLRPSGNQGPVATSRASFANYQANEAWIWEHLALTRARVVSGPEVLAQKIEEIRCDVIRRNRTEEEVLVGVADMRARIAAAKTASSVWDAKTGPGRMLDIELLAQAGALMAGSPVRDVARGLRAAVSAGWLEADDADTLQTSYRLFWAVQMAGRLITGRMLTEEQIGDGGAAFLCRSTGFDGVDALAAELEQRYQAADRIIGAALHLGDRHEG
ncbi:glutamine-synthetase adenylyltransferase [Thalassococcus sp. S3]|uniref:[protein-PII] uridylyltransferase family protein n=1 Tax=Thalassococcus sp. S3 TaxID=2017482 RepID=UPI00102473BF|nr:glutamine-synthetase adenylyltransferase [Thalassococcus sp. S3]QBF31544.1 glutamine-synthetase adenylyltransferase [Thalassococcus sp. S3]